MACLLLAVDERHDWLIFATALLLITGETVWLTNLMELVYRTGSVETVAGLNYLATMTTPRYNNSGILLEQTLCMRYHGCVVDA